MFENRLPSDRLDALAAGEEVLIEAWGNWHEAQFLKATVTRVTATQIVVSRNASNGVTLVERYRKRDGQRVGNANSRAELVDPEHPRTLTAFASAKRRQREREIDNLAHSWSRDRDDLDRLRRLHIAIGQHLAAEVAR